LASHGGATGTSTKTMKAAKDMPSSETVKRRNCTRSTSHSTMPAAIGTTKWQK